RARISRRLAWLRLVVFLAFLALASLASTSHGVARTSAATGSVAAAIAFIWLLRRHGDEKRRVAWLAALAQVNAEAAARVRRTWAALPSTTWPDVEPTHPYAA